ncbi:MAG TPA: ATP synthase F0 subunit B [Geopsychrobacteraceae bacterium]|nr:ATP synthase F0 subunit B [Geopsychrobacteraceae bacterium]
MRKYRTTITALILVLMMVGVSIAAGGGDHEAGGALLKDFLWRILNFGLMAALLTFFLRKPIKNGLASRREGIEKALTEAKQAKADAEAKFAEYDQKLALATEEIEEISNAIRREGELEQKKIIESAREMAIKIEKDAENAAALEVAKARSELQREAVELAVTLAEDLLKKNFTKEDDARLIDEYMKKVGELH